MTDYAVPHFGILFLTGGRLNRVMASEPNETSYIVGEMIPAYRAASQQYGNLLFLFPSYNPAVVVNNKKKKKKNNAYT